MHKPEIESILDPVLTLAHARISPLVQVVGKVLEATITLSDLMSQCT